MNIYERSKEEIDGSYWSETTVDGDEYLLRAEVKRDPNIMENPP